MLTQAATSTGNEDKPSGTFWHHRQCELQSHAGEIVRSPASQEGINHEDEVVGLLGKGFPEAAVLMMVNEDELGQARCKDGGAQQGTAEDESQEESVIPLQAQVKKIRTGH